MKSYDDYNDALILISSKIEVESKIKVEYNCLVLKCDVSGNTLSDKSYVLEQLVKDKNGNLIIRAEIIYKIVINFMN